MRTERFHKLQLTSRAAGFTLVEVLIAMVLFTMVIAGGFAGISRGFQLVEASRNYTRSSQMLQSELELLRTLPWATFSALSDTELTEKFQDLAVFSGMTKSDSGEIADLVWNLPNELDRLITLLSKPE